MTGRAGRFPAGLCDTCEHQRLVRTGRGSEFSMCLRHRTDPRYRKYPPIPVVRCRGYAPLDGTDDGPGGRAPETGAEVAEADTPDGSGGDSSPQRAT